MLPDSAWPPQSLPHEDGSIQVGRDFWLPVPGRYSLVPVPVHAVHAAKPALCPPTRETKSVTGSTPFPPALADPDWSQPSARLPPAALAPVACRATVGPPKSPSD